MARGSLAKERVMNRIREIYGNDYVGTENNKLYVYEDDGGERVQIAISCVCPKEGLTRKTTAEEIKENKNPILYDFITYSVTLERDYIG